MMGLDDHWGQAHILISAVGRNSLSHGPPLGLARIPHSGDGQVRSQLASHLFIFDRPRHGLEALTLLGGDINVERARAGVVCVCVGGDGDAWVNVYRIAICISSHGAGRSEHLAGSGKEALEVGAWLG